MFVVFSTAVTRLRTSAATSRQIRTLSNTVFGTIRTLWDGRKHYKRRLYHISQKLQAPHVKYVPPRTMLNNSYNHVITQYMQCPVLEPMFPGRTHQLMVHRTLQLTVDFYLLMAVPNRTPVTDGPGVVACRSNSLCTVSTVRISTNKKPENEI